MSIGKFLAAVMDCRDPLALSTFWQQILGGDVDSQTATAEWVALSGVPGLGYLGFQKVPEKKAVKNRVHFGVTYIGIFCIQFGFTRSRPR